MAEEYNREEFFNKTERLLSAVRESTECDIAAIEPDGIIFNSVVNTYCDGMQLILNRLKNGKSAAEKNSDVLDDKIIF